MITNTYKCKYTGITFENEPWENNFILNSYFLALIQFVCSIVSEPTFSKYFQCEQKGTAYAKMSSDPSLVGTVFKWNQRAEVTGQFCSRIKYE